VQRSVAHDDRRSFFVELTPDGRRRLRESRPTHNEVVRSRLTDQLTAPQLASLGTLFDKLLGRSRSAR
jgi:DNA-binding MarR family transcriptional regulator